MERTTSTMMMMMMAQEKRAGKQKYSYSPSNLVPPPLHFLAPPPVVVCLMSEKIYKIEIENKLTTLFVAHAEREGAGTAEPREECLDIIKDGPHDCTGGRGVGGDSCCRVLPRLDGKKKLPR